MRDLPLDHYCPWREEAEELRGRLTEVEAKLEAVMAAMASLERRVLGPKSEKMPPVGRELRKERDPNEAREAALRRRRERDAARAKLRGETVLHHVGDELRRCPRCGNDRLGTLGDGKRTTVYEYVPGYFVRQEHVQEKLACRCGDYIVAADPPLKPIEKGHYGPGFIAHLVTMKCADSIPLYRLAKQYERLGIPMSRSTMTDLFLAAAEHLEPLYRRLLEIVAAAPVVGADETSLKMLREKKRGFMWTFLTEDTEGQHLIAYKFSGDRSGETPKRVLGGTNGTLVVDAYTGYNQVTQVDGRERAGCLAHTRRKFFEALSHSPNEARAAMDLILEVYRVEHDALAQGIVRSSEHLALRQTRSRATMARFHQWLIEQRGRHPPKGPLGTAINYALNQWEFLTRFLNDVRIPVDNNASERALRVVALGRKNFLFVGHEEAGVNLAGLYSLVATCEANDVDPVEYLRDVLIRVHTDRASAIDDLLPHRLSRLTGPVA